MGAVRRRCIAQAQERNQANEKQEEGDGVVQTHATQLAFHDVIYIDFNRRGFANKVQPAKKVEGLLKKSIFNYSE